MEFYKLLEGYEARARREHSIQAFFFSLLANMQIARQKNYRRGSYETYLSTYGA